MSWAFRLYISGLIVCPLFIVFDDPWSHALAGAFCLLLLVIVLLALRPGEAKFGYELLRPYVALACLPAVWITIQVVPLPAALMAQIFPGSSGLPAGQSGWTSLSIDTTASLVALGTYVCALALAISATFLSIDRIRAERLLLLLTVLATCVAVVRPVHDLGGFFFLGEVSSVGPRASITSAAVVGMLLNCATAVLLLERFETRRNKRGQIALPTTIGGVVAALTAGGVCLIILIVFSSQTAVFAALTGLGAQFLITAFRRLGLTPRAGYLLAAIGVAVPVAFVAGNLSSTRGDFAIRFDPQASDKVVSAVQDAISAAPVFGFGAGTFRNLMAADVQMNGSRTPGGATPPTTMAGLTLALGKPAALVILIAALTVAVLLIRGALTRGRDSFFSALGASALLALTAEAFVDASLFSAIAVAIDTAILGLAIAQSASRSSTT